MSQLERALARARAEGQQAHAEGSEVDPGRPASVFASSWDLQKPAQPVKGPRRDSSPRPAIAATPSRQAPASRPVFTAFSPAITEKLVVGDEGSLELREEFRKVAASLYRLRETRALRVVMVVSALPGEGKSLTSTNLALTLSESYDAQVLLLDADLRRPTLHDLFSVPNTAGLREGLSATDGSVVSPVRISERLDLLTAGRASMDPMAALTSDRMRGVIARAAEVYDWVIIDTPPVELLPDAGLLTSEADGAILVLRAGSTSYRLARRAVEAIGTERVLGIILNQLTDDMSPDARKHYGYYGEPQTRSIKP